MRIHLIVGALYCFLAMGTGWCGEAVDPARRAEEFMRRLDTVGHSSDPEVRKRAGWPEPDSHLKELREINSQLREYVAKNPTNSRAAILSVKTYFLGVGLDPFGFFKATQSSGSTGLDVYGRILDQALRADSLNAELHYWKGQVDGDLRSGAKPSDPRLHEAVRETRRAVSLDPKSTRYREALASLLLKIGDEAGARDLYREVRADHPMYLSLHDWERIPHIEGLQPLQGMGADMPGLMTGTGPGTRMFLFRGRAAEFEQRCRNVWPGFALVREDSSARPKDDALVRGDRLFRWNGDVLELEPDVRKQPARGNGGIWVVVVEERADERKLPYLGEGVKIGDVYCTVGFVNLRKQR